WEALQRFDYQENRLTPQAQRTVMTGPEPRMKPKSQNRLAILRLHMDAWAGLPRHNRQLVAEIIFEQFNASGLAEHIAGTGVEFTGSDDYANDMRVRSQKLWRWIGAYEDCKPQ